MLIIAAVCYRNVIRNEPRYDAPKKNAKDFDLLVNIGIGWLWMSMEAAVERAEQALRSNRGGTSRAPANIAPKAA